MVGAAPTYRASSGVANGANASSFTITIPAAVQVGDLMIIGHATSTLTLTLTVPSGWTEFHTINTAGGAGRYSTFYRVAQAGDTGGATTVLLTNATASTDRQVGVFAAYSGAAASPFDASTITVGADSLTGTSPSITTTVNNTAVVRISSVRNATVSISLASTPATERAKGSGGGRMAIGLSDAEQAAAGATGTGTFTTTGVSGTWFNASFALKGT